MTTFLVEGWTERIRHQLKSDNVVVDLTDADVELLVRDHDDVDVALGGTSGIDTALEGIAFYDPTGSEFQASGSPYTMRYKVTDQSGAVSFFPNGDPGVIKVRAT